MNRGTCSGAGASQRSTTSAESSIGRLNIFLGHQHIRGHRQTIRPRPAQEIEPASRLAVRCARQLQAAWSRSMQPAFQVAAAAATGSDLESAFSTLRFRPSAPLQTVVCRTGGFFAGSSSVCTTPRKPSRRLDRPSSMSFSALTSFIAPSLSPESAKPMPRS